jgi:hypothetical protein
MPPLFGSLRSTWRNMVAAGKASRLFGQAERHLRDGELVAAHDTAHEALRLLFEPDIERESGPVVSVVICATLLLDEVCQRLGRPQPDKMIRAAYATIQPLKWVPPVERTKIEDLLKSLPAETKSSN